MAAHTPWDSPTEAVSIGTAEVATSMQTVQPALDESTPCRPGGPALGTGVPAEGLALAGTGHCSAGRRLELGTAVPIKSRTDAPFLLQNHSKLCLGGPQE